MEQDNKNKGIVGKPWPEQQLILTGKCNVMGEDGKIAMITAESRDGGRRLEVYQQIGVLFTNDKNGNDKAPDYSGPLDGLHKDWRIAGWKGEKNGDRYMTLKVSEVIKKTNDNDDHKQDQSSQVLEDDIPF